MIVAGASTYAWTLMAGRSYYDRLLAAGVEIHEYQAGLYHPKTLTIDGSWSLIGTMNFDNRSLLLNFEVGLAFYGPEVARQLEEQFEKDLRHAERIDPERWYRRTNWQALKENFWRLFEPVF
jgi:cardiolipin synthase